MATAAASLSRLLDFVASRAPAGRVRRLLPAVERGVLGLGAMFLDSSVQFLSVW